MPSAGRSRSLANTASRRAAANSPAAGRLAETTSRTSSAALGRFRGLGSRGLLPLDSFLSFQTVVLGLDLRQQAAETRRRLLQLRRILGLIGRLAQAAIQAILDL